MNKIIAAAAALLVSGACFAQAGTAVKEGAKATSDKAQEAGQTVAGATTSGPKSVVHKVKAKVHKAKASHEATESKDAAKAAVK